MSKPKKWLRVTSIDQITVGARVRLVDGDNDPLEFTVRGVSPAWIRSHLTFAHDFDRRDRAWFIRNPEWTKPKKADGLHEGHSAKHWHRRWGISVEYNRTLAATIRELEARIAELEAAPAPEPVMPEEPPVRTPWRVKGGDGIFFQFAEGGMHANLQYADLFGWFTSLVKPGDEIELLELRPVGEGNE